MLQHLKPPFDQSFDTKVIPVLFLQGKELLPQSFHVLLFVEVSVHEVSDGSEKVIIWGSWVWTKYWVWYQLYSLKFQKFIPETSTYANAGKLLTHPSNTGEKLSKWNVKWHSKNAHSWPGSKWDSQNIRVTWKK